MQVKDAMLNRVSINTLLQIVSRLMELISGLFVNAYLARRWGSLIFGQIGFFSSLAGVCAFLFDLGLSNLLVRSIARDRKLTRHYIVNGLFAMLPMSLLASVVVTVIGVTCTSGSMLPVLLLACLQVVLTVTVSMLRASFYAYERMEFESLSVVFDRCCWIGGGLFLAFRPASLTAIFICLVSCRLVNLLVSTFLYCRYILPRTEPARVDWGLQRSLVRQALPFGLNLAFSTIYVSLDVLLVARWGGDSQAGYYRAASMLMVPLALIAVSLNNAVFPRMSAAAKSDPKAVCTYNEACNRLVMASAMPIATFVALFAPNIVSLLYGKAYAPAIPMLQLLSLVVPLRYLNNSLATALTAGNQQKRRMYCAGVAAAFNVVSNVLVIHRYHALGACFTTLATDLLIVVLLGLELRKAFGRGGFELPKAFRSLIVACVVVVPLAVFKVPLFAAGAVAVLAYPLLLSRARVLTPFELGLLLRRA